MMTRFMERMERKEVAKRAKKWCFVVGRNGTHGGVDRAFPTQEQCIDYCLIAK